MPAEIRTCLDRYLPLGEVPQAAAAAQLENTNNAPAFDPQVVLPGVDLTASGAVLTGKLWKAGRTLHIRFLDGDPAVQKRLQPFAHVWSQFAAITFVFDNDPNAEIRISFKERGSWSYIGTDCLTIARDKPTMNFGWLTPTLADEEYSRVVTHEFGHALGLIHEHQNPIAEIPWDKPKVYAYYAGPPNNWSQAQTDINLFRRYSRDITQFSQFDPKSIMLYPIPNDFTIGDYEVGWNKALSETDQKFITAIYPPPTKTDVTLTIDAPPVAASIGEFGEIDTYVFAAPADGRYRIETTGAQDLVMSLFGPNDPTLALASDDDSGIGLNPRIIRPLRAGSYTVRIRHFNKSKRGDYQIQVRTER
ncbi:MAG: pre-peptidase C-terminal domain-containing protein [Anaerolineales bacterium]|nr:pre-peptidase C-terminal domain-containing protein [Anaerolineales bacterium]